MVNNETREPTLTPEFKAFKDGVYDAVVYNKNTSDSHIDYVKDNHFYKRGYDFGLTLLSDMDGEEE